MYRVSLANAFAKRTLRPLYEKHQATPVAIPLYASESQTIYSGMVATLRTDGTVEICDGTTQVPFGLFALDYNSVINDLDGQPNDLVSASSTEAGATTSGFPFAVWQGGPDAYFRIDAPAFDTTQTYTVGQLLYADAAGLVSNQLNTDALPIGRVIEVVSSTRMVINVNVPGSFTAAQAPS